MEYVINQTNREANEAATNGKQTALQTKRSGLNKFRGFSAANGKTSPGSKLEPYLSRVPTVPQLNLYDNLTVRARQCLASPTDMCFQDGKMSAKDKTWVYGRLMKDSCQSTHEVINNTENRVLPI